MTGAGRTRCRSASGRRPWRVGARSSTTGVTCSTWRDISRVTVAEVFARTATLSFEVEVEDTAQVSLRFASGALG